MAWMEGSEEAAAAGTVRRAQAGDPEAFREIVETHGRGLFRLAYRLIGDEAGAEDVVQETLLKAHKQLRMFDGRSALGTWLHRIAVNCSYDWLRRARRTTRREDPLAAPDEPGFEARELVAADAGPERSAASSEIGAAVRRGIATLTQLERAAFVLRHFEGRSIAHLCSVLGLEESAGKHAVFRAVRKMRQQLEPYVP
jgi:RNA polymerase sigma-70 factor (ECF subfamily)